jgi:hypothetical protein
VNKQLFLQIAFPFFLFGVKNMSLAELLAMQEEYRDWIVNDGEGKLPQLVVLWQREYRYCVECKAKIEPNDLTCKDTEPSYECHTCDKTLCFSCACDHDDRGHRIDIVYPD